MKGTVLYAVVCAAGPATRVRTLIAAAQDRGYDVCLITTPSAACWLHDELPELAHVTGHPVCSTYRQPTESDVLPRPDAVLVAPATFNTINKWAAGIADTLALGLINEAIGKRIPIVVVPSINDAMAVHPAISASITTLQNAGVTVLKPDQRFTAENFPWEQALDALSVNGR